MVSLTDIAIVGMSALFPGCRDLAAYWQNILNKVDNVHDAPDEWTGSYFEPNSQSNDRLYTRKGGFLGELAEFNPLEFGIMPNSLEAGDPDHFLSLKLARDALFDAGYSDRPFNREKTGIILGRGTYTNRGSVSGVQHGIVLDQTLNLLRQIIPALDRDTLSNIRKELEASLPAYSTDSIPGMVPNLLTGRIANRLDLMGPNYIVDAACASSLIAVELAIDELLNGRCDMMLAGGVQAATPPQIFMMFCKLGALSRSKIRPFDAEADGTLLAEGLGMLVIKRLTDAERDGDRIYAVIKGLGSSSDGKELGLLAPRLQGQVLALQRVYENSIEPDTVELVEAHGTGMQLGDKTEIQSLTSVFGQRQEQIPRCALGTVKSAIGHCIPAAGIASTIKTALALYHKILPPTLCDRVNPALEIEKTPFYINTEARPWIHGNSTVPRRAGVNAFGFGGINAHALLEEYTGLQTKDAKLLHKQWDTELLIFSANGRESLIAFVKKIQQILTVNVNIELANLAYTLSSLARGTHRLAIVAKDVADLESKLHLALEKLTDFECSRLQIHSGIYYTDPKAIALGGKTAFLFPGEGSQYPNMLADLCLHFPKVRAWFDTLDENFPDKNEYLPSSLIFPPPTCITEEERDFIAKELFSMKVAPGALLVANLALYELLSDLGIGCDVMVGHSSGENAALTASGTIPRMEQSQLINKFRHLNQIYTDLEAQDKIPKGALLSVGAIDPAFLKQFVDSSSASLHLAMDNCRNQAVLFGSEADIDEAATQLKKAGGICVRLPFDRAYHTPLFEEVEAAFRPYYDDLEMVSGHTRLYSCVTCEAFPEQPEAIRDVAIKHMSARVRFRETIEKLYDREQVRTFITVGPGDDLTAFVNDIIGDRDYLAVASNTQRKSGLEQIQHLLARLFTNRRQVDLTHLYRYRELTQVSLDPAIPEVSQKPKPVLDLSMPIMRLKPDFVSSIQDKLYPELQSRGSEGVGGAEEAEEAEEEKRLTTHHSPPATPSHPSTPASSISLSGISAHFELMQEFLASQARVTTMLFSGCANDKNGEYAESSVTPFSNENFLLTNHINPIPEEMPKARRSEALDTKSAKEEAINLEILQEKESSPFPTELNQQEASPLLGQIIERDAQHLYCDRHFDIERDVFLHDHTISGGALSQSQPELLALPVIPFTVSMEILAEAAASLVGDNKFVTSLYNLRGYRWLALDRGQLHIGILAKLQPRLEDRTWDVHVQLFELSDRTKRFLAFEGYVKLSDRFSLSPSPMTFDPGKLKSSKPVDADLYRTIMFHGPRFQGVKHLSSCGEQGIEADLQVIANNNYFTHIEQPVFQIDASLLDAAGQLVGFWVAAQPEMDFIVFPFQVESFHQYQPPLPPGSLVMCRGLIRHISQLQTEASFDFLDETGRVIARLEGWQDRYFSLPSNYCQCRIHPQTAYLSKPWMQAETGLVSRCIEPFPEQFFDGAWGIWKRILAHLILNASERDIWYKLPEKGSRRSDWLLGRAAAKDAVRQWAKQNFNIELAPVDIEILSTESGKPRVSCPALEAIATLPDISISHSHGYVVAAVAKQNKRIGIDVEQIDSVRADDLLSIAFTPAEQKLISQQHDPATIVGFWCAKEAAAKALGKGLEGVPQQWCITHYSADGKVIVSHFSETFEVKLWYQDTKVIAICSV